MAETESISEVPHKEGSALPDPIGMDGFVGIKKEGHIDVAM